MEYQPYQDKVLCGDCLKVKNFTNDRHNGVELCDCGGEFCGCADCTYTINALNAGKRKADDIRCQRDIEFWNEKEGKHAKA